MSNREKVALRKIDEFFSGERSNPRVCLTEVEADKIMEEHSVYLRKGNIANDSHEPTLYMYKIIAH